MLYSKKALLGLATTLLAILVADPATVDGYKYSSAEKESGGAKKGGGKKGGAYGGGKKGGDSGGKKGGDSGGKKGGKKGEEGGKNCFDASYDITWNPKAVKKPYDGYVYTYNGIRACSVPDDAPPCSYIDESYISRHGKIPLEQGAELEQCVNPKKIEYASFEICKYWLKGGEPPTFKYLQLKDLEELSITLGHASFDISNPYDRNNFKKALKDSEGPPECCEFYIEKSGSNYYGEITPKSGIKPGAMAAMGWSSEFTTQQNGTAADETPGGRHLHRLQQSHQAHGGRKLEGYGGDDDDDGYEQKVRIECYARH
jgi:hypothetical protein